LSRLLSHPHRFTRSPYCSAILEGRIAGGVTLWSGKSKPSIRIAPHGSTISDLNTCRGRSAKTGFQALQKSTTLNLLAN
jgi:hypothetical protein